MKKSIKKLLVSDYSDTRSHWAKDRIERWTSLGIFKCDELTTVLNNI